MKVVSIVGARPQFVKLAPISKALARADVEHVIVHTGQHYEAAMSDVFFDDLRIPAPDVALGIGSGSHAVQTGAMLSALEPVLQSEAPDWTLVYGDTNSTLAGAICAVKLHLPVAHLEAGLRSFNRRMPEEHNRILTDHASDLLLAPTKTAARHLENEGLAAKTLVVGDVMADICLAVADAVKERSPNEIAPNLTDENYVVATLHRAENTDDADRLRRLIGALESLPLPVILPVHPRLRETASRLGLDLGRGALTPINPLSYPDMVALVARARSVVTDSGGLQKEAYILGVPCTTLRSETEWTETLDGGWNVLIPEAEGLQSVALRGRPTAIQNTHFGSGSASEAVVRALTG